MSGASAGRPARSDAQWARNVEARLRALEHAQTQRVGPWTILDQAGRLLAMKPGIDPIALDGSTVSDQWAMAGRQLAIFDKKIADAVAAAETALEYWANVLDQLLGTGHQISDFVAFLEGLLPIEQFNALLTALYGVPVIGPMLQQVQQLIDAIAQGFGGQAGQTIAQLQVFLAGIPGAAAVQATLNSLLTQLYGGTTILSSLLAANIPGLDASKIISGVFGAAQLQPLIDAISQGYGGLTGKTYAELQTFLAGLPAAGAVQAALNSLLVQLYGGTTVLPALLAGNIPGLDAAKIISGVLDPTRIPALAIAAITDLADYLTHLNPTTGVYEGTLLASQIPALAISAVTNLQAYLAHLDLSGVYGGSLLAGQIPGLDASKIVTGVFAAAQVQSLIDAISQGFGGGPGSTYAQLQTFIAGLPNAGAVQASLNNLLTQLYGGTTILSSLMAGNIPNLDASKITTGTFAAAQLQALIDSIAAGYGGTSGKTYAQLQTFLAGLPSASAVQATLNNLLTQLYGGTAILSSLLEGNIPNLAASKITSGTFDAARIPALAISAITNLANYLAHLDSSGVYGGSVLASQVSAVLGGADLGVDVSTVNTALAGAVKYVDEITDWVGSGTNLTGAAGLTQIIADLKTVLGAIGLGTGAPGIGDSASIPASIGALRDALVTGLTQTTATGSTAADVTNWITKLVDDGLATTGIAQAVSQVLANRAFTVPGWHAVDTTLHASLNIAGLPGNTAAPPLVAIAPNTPTIAFVQIPDTSVKGTVAWVGYTDTTTGTLTKAVVNLYKLVDAAWQKLVLGIDATEHLHSGTSYATAAGWTYVETGQKDSLTQGNWVAIEMRTEGTATYYVIGAEDHYLPNNTQVIPQHLGGTRAADYYPAPYHNIGTATGTGGAGTSKAITIDITIPTDCNYLLVPVNVLGYLFTGCSAKIGAATNIPQVTSAQYYNTGSVQGWGIFFGLASPPTGPQTITVTGTASSGGSVYLDGTALDYDNVLSVVANTPAAGTGIALSSSATATANRTIAQMFCTQGPGTFSNYIGATQRYLGNPTGGNGAMVVGDVVSTGSPQSFGCTLSAAGTYNGWAHVACTLTGMDPVAPDTITPTYSKVVPGFALSSVIEGSRGRHAPESGAFGLAGTYTAPTWQLDGDTLTFVLIGGGGGGEGEIGINLGSGGFAGEWNGVLLTCGVDYYPAGDSRGQTVFTVTPGGPGAGIIGYFANGGPGGASTVTWTDPSSTQRTVSAAGGIGGYPYAGNCDGRGAGNFEYPTASGNWYYGGAYCMGGFNGNFPGGGGGGALPFQPSSGWGAGGEVWAKAFQTPG